MLLVKGQSQVKGNYALTDLFLECENHICSLLFIDTPVVDPDPDIPVYQIALSKFTIPAAIAFSQKIRQTQECLSVFVDLKASQNLKYIGMMMAKVMILARTSDPDKRRIIITNYNDRFLPFIPDPAKQVQQEPMLLYQVRASID